MDVWLGARQQRSGWKLLSLAPLTAFISDDHDRNMLKFDEAKKNCECGNGSELFNGFWEDHADARHAVAGVSGP
ncbi:hypothetical protein DPMN_021658 [Dreissena polymorpha]|uniref:Uncharacterized protein n=1 Tax=Dreissena polymorpha TaxID=45954 RepID=A0A9D4NL61_DREPO|nr:hypothetical protein DPMN_021658 [Dreissena polymorpha]